jgi:GNAT superfamily N-acetyltransferase
MTSVTLKNGKTLLITGLHERPEYIDRAAELMFGEWDHFWAYLGYRDPQSVAGWLRSVQGPATHPYYGVGTVDGELACFAGVDENERIGDPRMPWLIDVFVLPEFRGIGAFKPIVSHIMASQRDRGFTEMWLWTQPHQKVLYEGLGWQYLQDEEWVTGPNNETSPNPVMRVDLSQYPPK